MEITGIIHEIGETVKVTDSLRKREVVIEYAENPQYPEYIKLEAVNDRCDLLNGCSIGQAITAHFNLRGRPWTDKTGKKSYFNSLLIWKVQ